MAAPMQDNVLSLSESKQLAKKQDTNTHETTEYNGQSKQDLLDTIQQLQNQLAALKNTQEIAKCTASGGEQVKQGDQKPSISLQSTAAEESAGQKIYQGWEKVEGTTYSVIKQQDTSSKTKGRKVKLLKPFDFTRYNKRHVALLIAYLGWDYQGFASQVSTENTIEAELFDALIKTRLIENRASSNYTRCGRTDKGVSAFKQVIALDLRSNLFEGHGVIQRSDNVPREQQGKKDVEIDYAKLINRVLSERIRVLAWSPVEVNFSARFDCFHRTYKYFFPKGDLDIEAMQRAAKKLLGQHDFRNLCKMDVANGVVNFVRTIRDVDISPVDESCGGYQMYVFRVQGQAFLYHQVRCMVAILMLVGQHKEEPEIIERLLDVEKQPCKPQYSMAVDYPLVLYHSGFGDKVNWRYEKYELDLTMSRFQTMWANYSIRTATVWTMLNDLAKVSVPHQTDDNTSQHKNKGISHHTGKNTSLHKGKGTLHHTGEEMSRHTGEGTSHHTDKGTFHQTGEGTSHQTGEGTPHHKTEGTLHLTGEDTSQHTEGTSEKKELLAQDKTNRVLLKQSAKLVMGANTRVYKPLLKRAVGESLENRIKHYSKKFKLAEPEET